jgi:hypothetical protein
MLQVRLAILVLCAALAGVHPALPQQVGAAHRQAEAAKLGQYFVKRGYPMAVNTEGAGDTALVFRWTLMTRPAVYRLINMEGLHEACIKAGFKVVAFSDGFSEVWRYTVEPIGFREQQ